MGGFLRWLASLFRRAPTARPLPVFPRAYWQALVNALRSRIAGQLQRYRDILSRSRARPDDAALRARLREELDELTKLRGELNEALDRVATSAP